MPFDKKTWNIEENKKKERKSDVQSKSKLKFSDKGNYELPGNTPKKFKLILI